MKLRKFYIAYAILIAFLATGLSLLIVYVPASFMYLMASFAAMSFAYVLAKSLAWPRLRKNVKKLIPFNAHDE